RLNAPFFTRVLHHRPHVTVKVAMSLDGKFATRNGDSFPMTGPEARARVHLLRDRIDAILIGRRTAELDNPRLTCRLDPAEAAWGGPRDPTRIVLDPNLTLPLEHRVFQLQANRESKATTIVVVGAETDIPQERRLALDDLGVSVIGSLRLADGRFDIPALLGQLVEHDINSVLVEGGGTTLAHIHEAGCVDAWIAHVAPVLVGGASAPTPLDGLGAAQLADALRLSDAQVTRLGHDIEIAAPVMGHVYGLD
ncbi:MAG: RibD family protein, partial [Myxococcota bacterium]